MEAYHGGVLLMSAILRSRLERACALNERQRGFIRAPGCSENLTLLDGLIKLRKRESLPLAVVFIDFAKAFDSVSHDHLKAALVERGVDRLRPTWTAPR